MKDNTVNLRYNSNLTIQTQPVKRESWDWEHVYKKNFTILYGLEGNRKSTKIHNKNQVRERPKSAGEVLIQSKIHTEGLLIKRSISLSSIEDFFLKRRIPLIKPLISEREILKLQLLQAQCKSKAQQRFRSIQSGTESDEIFVKLHGVEDEDVNKYTGLFEDFIDEKSKERARDATSPLSSPTVKREDKKKQGDKIREVSKRTKSPTLGKTKQEKLKELSHGKSKSGMVKQNKVGKGGKSPKKQLGTSRKEKTSEDESKIVKNKAKRINETNITRHLNELKSSKSSGQSEHQSKGSNIKGKSKYDKRAGEFPLTNEDSDKIGSKGSSQKSSKQKIKAGQSEVESIWKRSREHSKDKLSQGNKSGRSDNSGSGKSRKMSNSTEKRHDRVSTDVDLQSQGKKYSETEDSLEKKHLSGISKADKNAKKRSTSEKAPDSLAKDKTLKMDTEGKLKTTGKIVKFSNAFEHMIHYVLSNPVFVKLGWTLAPSDRAQLQIVTFRTVPSSPHTYCFRERTEDETKYYSVSLDKIAFNFRIDGTGEIFYPSGSVAATLTKHHTGMRLTLYSEPKNDPLVRGSHATKVLGIFDSSGNGVVYNSEGKKLLNFNQLEGIFYSPHIKSSYKWQWCDYKVIESQRVKALLRYIAKEQKEPMQLKKSAPATGVSLKKPKSEEKKEIDDEYKKILAELPYPVAQKAKTKINHIWGFKPITLKINNEMTLRINGQDDVAINFSSNQIFLRIDLGVKVDPDVVERIEALAPKKVSDIPCVFDCLLDLSPSLQQLTSPLLKQSLI